jgi:metal-responsive CopG/Arc/MetJ family transcriptional regulator
MKNLSLKLDKALFEETEIVITALGKNRNRYINEAIAAFNRVQKRNLLAAQLQAESKLVADSSMKVLMEFEGLEDENQAI